MLYYYKYLFFKNDEFELYLFSWFPHAKSPIHNHPEKGCFVKILDGTLTEEVFTNKKELKLINKQNLDTNSIGYRSGDYILHRIKNETNNIVKSIHIYFHQNFKVRTWNE